VTDSTPSSVAADGGVFIANVVFLVCLFHCLFFWSDFGVWLKVIGLAGKRRTLLAFRRAVFSKSVLAM
jgi:hypothetical protein